MAELAEEHSANSHSPRLLPHTPAAGTIPVSLAAEVRTDAPVVQRRGHQPGVRARRCSALQVGRVANAPGPDHLQPRSQRLNAAQGVEVGPRVGAHSVERHHDHARGPPFGVGVTAGGIEQAALAAIE